jgi:hypothetical protein
MDAPQLDSGTKGKRKEIFGSMLQKLESYGTSNFHFPWAGDESWMFYE